MIHVEPIGLEGFRLISALYGAAFGDDWPEPSLCDLLGSPGVETMIGFWQEGERAAEPAGFAIFRTVADEAELLSLGVSPDRRRYGIASALITNMHQYLKTTEARTVFLEVGADNPGAAKLYETHNYTIVGRRREYYRRANGNRVDALVMRSKIVA